MTREARRPSIAPRVRIALFIAGAVCIGVTAGVFYLLWSRQTLATRTLELRRQVSIVAAGIAVSDILPGSAADTGAVRARLLDIEAGLAGARLAVVDGAGHVLFGTGAAAPTAYPVAQLASGSSEADPRVGVLDVTGVGRSVVVAIPVSFPGPGGPDRYVLGARSLSNIGAADQWVALAILVAGAAGLVVAWPLGGLLTRRLTGPLVRLTEGAQAIAHGEWGRQVPVEGDDEAGRLAGAFNDMSSRVAAAYRAQQAFVGDVSHEIRTPVTSIRGFADAIADGTVADEAGVKRAAGIISAEASRLAEITASLLSLADLEAGAVTLSRRPVDAAGLARDLRDRFDLIAAGRAVDLEIDLGAAGPMADPERVLQVLSTLVENALAHARSRVRVEALPRAAAWTVVVDDDGRGVPQEDRERIFGRFTRLDASRSTPGSGLGLAIARRLVEMMGGSVSADSAPDLGGARFVLRLPGAPEPTAASTETQSPANPVPTATGDPPHEGGQRSAPVTHAKEHTS